MRHALVLTDDGCVPYRPTLRRFFNRVFDGFTDQAFHALAVLFFYFVVLVFDQAFQQLGVLFDPRCSLFQHAFKFRVFSLRCYLFERLDHLVICRPEIFQFFNIKLLQRCDF